MAKAVKTYPLSRKDRNEIALAWDGESFDAEGTFARTVVGDWAIRVDSFEAGKGSIVKVTKRSGETSFVILTMFEQSSYEGGTALYSFMNLDRAIEIATEDKAA